MVIFYTKSQIETLKREIKSGKSISQIAREQSTIMDRTENGLQFKIRTLKGKMEAEKQPAVVKNTNKIKKKRNHTIPIKRFSNEEMVILTNLIKERYRPITIAEKYSKEWGRTKSSIVCKCQAILRSLGKQEPVINKKIAQPAQIGISLPEGMSFQGVPKKVVLFSDHFKVYF